VIYHISIVIDKIGYILHDMTRIMVEFGARVVGIGKMGEFAFGDEVSHSCEDFSVETMVDISWVYEVCPKGEFGWGVAKPITRLLCDRGESGARKPKVSAES
jgi:hypothetical protein